MQVKVGDYNINYEVFGQGKPVILLHGWLCSLETMMPLVENLKTHFKVYDVDVIGFGKSDVPSKPFTSNDFGNFLKEFIEVLKIENPILIGHSNGGRIIINAVGRNLVSANKIVLMDSAGIKPQRSKKYYLKVGIAKVGKKILSLLPNGDKIIDKMSSKFGSDDYKASSNVLKETMKIIVNEDMQDIMPNIKAPTLILWGTLDTATPISDGRRMNELIPDSGIVEYNGSSHFAFLENLQNVNLVLNEFLKNDM